MQQMRHSTQGADAAAPQSVRASVWQIQSVDDPAGGPTGGRTVG